MNRPPKHHPQYGGTLVYYADLPVGTEFYVMSGHWEGKIIEENGIKKVYVVDTEKSYEIEEGRHGWIR